MADPVKNFAATTVSAGYDALAVSIAVTAGGGALFPDPVVDGAFNLVWWNSSTYPNPTDDPNKEIVRCTARVADTFTITRAQEGTAATVKNSSGKTYKVALAFTKKVYDDLIASLALKLESETDPVFSAWLVATPPLFSETDPLSLHIDQTASQTVINGTPTFGVGIKAYHATVGSTIAEFSQGVTDQTTPLRIKAVNNSGFYEPILETPSALRISSTLSPGTHFRLLPFGGDIYFQIGDANSGNIHFGGLNDSDTFAGNVIFKTAGNVGIGIPIASPSYKLDVGGTGRFTNLINTGLTASRVVFTDAGKQLSSTGIGTAAQFIKADGSLDSSTYLTGETDPVWITDKPSYVPYTGATTTLNLGVQALSTTGAVGTGDLTAGTVSAGKNVTATATEGSELFTSFNRENYTFGTGWDNTNDTDTKLNKNADGIGQITLNGVAPTANVTYKIVFTIGTLTSQAEMSFGNRSASRYYSTGTYTEYITAYNTDGLKFWGVVTGARFTVTAISIKALTNATGDSSIFGDLIVKSKSWLRGPVHIGSNIPNATEPNYPEALNVYEPWWDETLGTPPRYPMIQAYNDLASIKMGCIGTYPGFWMKQTTPTLTNYAFLYDGATTIVNSPSGQGIAFRAGNLGKLYVSTSGGIATGTWWAQSQYNIPADTVVVPKLGIFAASVSLPTVSAFLHIIGTTEQARFGYDVDNYFKITVGSTGGVTFDAVGTGALFTFSDNILSNAATQHLFRDTAIGIYSQADTFMDLFADGAVRIGNSSAGAPTTYLSVEPDGDTFWTGDGTGLPYGSCYGNEIGWSQASAVQNTWYEISDADMADGQLNEVTHDGSGKLTVTKAGRYLCNYTGAFEASTGANVHIQTTFSVSGTETNDGMNHFETFGANVQHTSSGTAILDLAANATLEVSIRTTDAGTPNLACDHLNITCVMVGGT